MTDDCIFCKIVKGDIPATRILETETVLAFLDIGPIIKGHTLVIPKAHHDPLTDVPAPLLSDMMDAAKLIMQAQTRSLNATGVNLIQNNGSSSGQAVMHVHFHVIPRFDDDGHHWNWKTGSYNNPDEVSAMAAQLIAGLAQT